MTFTQTQIDDIDNDILNNVLPTLCLLMIIDYTPECQNRCNIIHLLLNFYLVKDLLFYAYYTIYETFINGEYAHLIPIDLKNKINDLKLIMDQLNP